MNKVTPKYTQEQCDAFNKYQHSGKFHPLTGDPCSVGKGSRADCPDGECLLIATEDGLVCPCGAYTQNWTHAFTMDTDF